MKESLDNHELEECREVLTGATKVIRKKSGHVFFNFFLDKMRVGMYGSNSFGTKLKKGEQTR